MPKPKTKKAAKKKSAAAAENRSAVMTDDQNTYTGDDQPTTAITTTEPEPAAIEGEVVPRPDQVDPHSLVDMRIRHDPRFLGDDAQLLPTTDPNYMYVKPKAVEPPPEEPAK